MTRNTMVPLLGLVVLTTVVAAPLILFKARSTADATQSVRLASWPPADEPAARSRYAACGWSLAADPREAVAEAAEKARRALDGKQISYVFVASTVQHDIDSIQREITRQFGDDVRVHGTTTSLGVITNDGIFRGPHGALGILAVAAHGQVRYGVSGVALKDFDSLEAAGREAIRRAIADAGMPTGRRPNVILISGTMLGGDETKVMAGIATVVGNETPVLGGNAGDDALDHKWRQFTRDGVFVDGIVLTAIYSDFKIGWAFETGFKVTDREGTVTKSDGKTIYEIDGQPALDVYDRWLDGKFYQLIRARGLSEAPMLTALNPLANEVKGSNGQIQHMVSRIVPDQKSLDNKSLRMFVNIQQGARIRLLSGNWQTMLNRAERAPRQAMIQGDIRPGKAAFSIFFFCKLASKVVPDSELTKLPLLTANSCDGVPFLGVVTLGEQGPMPGFQNVSAHLAESIVVFGQE